MPHVRLPYFHSCVGWPPDSLKALMRLIERRQDVSRRKLVANVDSASRRELEADLGYGRHFPIVRDFYVRYGMEPQSGVYFIVHSAIEHVFATPEQIEALQAAALADEANDSA
jgi:hypothetical protein